MEAEEREDRTELDDLFPELKETILRCVPLKPLTRLKCVSESWCRIAAELRRSHPPTTNSGLLVFLKNQELHQSCFLKLQHAEITHHQFATLHISTTHNFSYLVDSCNGLILYTKKDDRGFWNYYVSSPLVNQIIPLPLRQHKPSAAGRESLAFEPSSHPEFKIVCCFWEEINVAKEEEIECQIFWSGTWLWRDFKAPLKNSRLLLEDGFIIGQCFGPSVYINGHLYWIWSLCMVIFDIECEFFNLVQLPKSSSEKSPKRGYSMFLYESEGRIHYCEPTDGGFRVWAYESGWRAKMNVVSDELRSRFIRPCAFNEDLQVLYLYVPPGKVISYSFETGEAGEIWCLGKPGMDFIMCFVYPFLFRPVNLNSYMS